MYKVLLAIHVMTTIALIVIVLVQRSSSDGMGLSGSSSSNNFLSGRAAASFASRSTALLGLVFILTSLALGAITTHNHVSNGSIADKIKAMPVKQSAVPVPATAPVAPSTITPPAAPNAATPNAATQPTAPTQPAQQPVAAQPTEPAKPAATLGVPKPE